MEKAGIAEATADKLAEQKIDGKCLVHLTVEELAPHIRLGPAKLLVTATKNLWKCNKIHGVILAPAIPVSQCKKLMTTLSLMDSPIVVVGGDFARHHLGGLDQLFRYISMM